MPCLKAVTPHHIVQAEEADLEAILELQRLAYQGEARLLNDFSIPPLMQTLEEIEDREEKVRCAQVVGDKYSTISSEEYANRAADKIRVFRLNIEHISGKRLVKAGEPGMGYKKG